MVDYEPLEFIAEIGSNHTKKDGDGKPSLTRALTLIDEAAAAGATVAKFQLFTGEELHSEPEMVEKLNKIALPEAWLPKLKTHCTDNEIEFMCTPFSPRAVEVLNDYVERFKIASWDITYIPLLHAVRKTGKPVILSTAGATMQEVDDALELLRPGDEFPRDVTLLHCHAGYPIKLEQVYLRGMLNLGGRFAVDMDEIELIRYGLSSHFPDPIINAAAVLLGASVIEAHFDLPGNKGLEAGHSLDPTSFSEMVMYALKFQRALYGTGDIPQSEMQAVRMYRRNGDDWLRPLARKE